MGNDQSNPNNAIPVWDIGSTLDQVLAYDGDGNLITITATNGAKTWVKTFTWTTGNLTHISGWVLQ